MKSVSFSGDGSRIVSGSRTTPCGCGTRVWGVRVGSLGARVGVSSVSFSDGSRMCPGLGTRPCGCGTRVWGVRVGSAGGAHECGEFGVVFWGRVADIVSGSQDKTVRVWDAVSGEACWVRWRGTRVR